MADADDGIVLRGFVWKRSRFVKKWRRRWCTLSNSGALAFRRPNNDSNNEATARLFLSSACTVSTSVDRGVIRSLGGASFVSLTLGGRREGSGAAVGRRGVGTVVFFRPAASEDDLGGLEEQQQQPSSEAWVEAISDCIRSVKRMRIGKGLVAAAKSGQVAAVRRLLELGSDANETSSADATAEKATPLMAAAQRGHTAVARLLLEFGADIRLGGTSRIGLWTTPIHEAAEHGHTAIIALLLQRDAHLARLRANLERTPLHVAAAGGYADAVRFLLDSGAADDIDARDEHGDSPIHVAFDAVVPSRIPQVVTTLIAHGADCSAKNDSGDTSLHRACQATQGGDAERRSALDYVLQEDAARQEIETANAGGFTPLMVAAFNGNADACRCLLSAGAAVDTRFSRWGGFTALMIAKEAKKDDIVQLMLDAGANPSLKNTAGATAADL